MPSQKSKQLMEELDQAIEEALGPVKVYKHKQSAPQGKYTAGRDVDEPKDVALLGVSRDAKSAANAKKKLRRAVTRMKLYGSQKRKKAPRHSEAEELDVLIKSEEEN